MFIFFNDAHSITEYLASNNARRKLVNNELERILVEAVVA
jgi:hypothetical protein